MGLARLIHRGEVHDVDLGRPVGHEPGFVRPAVIVSTDLVSNGPGGLIMAVPIGSTPYGLRSHVELEPGATGLDVVSYARCDQLRVVSIDRLVGRRGRVGPAAMSTIDQALRFILEL